MEIDLHLFVYYYKRLLLSDFASRGGNRGDYQHILEPSYLLNQEKKIFDECKTLNPAVKAILANIKKIRQIKSLLLDTRGNMLVCP